MRVAYLINQYPKVSHTFVRREIAALRALGVELTCFSVRRVKEEFPDAADRAEARRTRVLLDAGPHRLLGAVLRWALTHPLMFGRAAVLAARVGWRSDRGVLRHAAYLAEACLLRSWLVRSGVQRLHAHFGTNSTTVAMLCHTLGGPPFSFTVHGPEEFDRSSGIGLREKIARASDVFGISEYGRSQLYRLCPADQWSKLHVIRCGVDDSFLGVPATDVPDVPRIVSVGRLAPQKGHALLVEALARLAAEGIDFELVFAGDGELRGDLQAAVEAHGLGDRIRISGWLSGDAVRDLLQSSRGLVMPSFAEGLPVVIMESLALGRPVLSTWVAGIPELVTPGECGWLVPAGSLDRLVKALREFLTTPVVELTRLGAEGRRRVAARHDVSAIARQILAIWAGRVPDSERAPARRRPDLPSAVHGQYASQGASK